MAKDRPVGAELSLYQFEVELKTDSHTCNT
jgi:hypothetical protein